MTSFSSGIPMQPGTHTPPVQPGRKVAQADRAEPAGRCRERPRGEEQRRVGKIKEEGVLTTPGETIHQV